MTSDTLLFDLADKVAVITLNRPAVRNALNRELSQVLMEALQRVRTDEDIRVAVLAGAGRTFCAGADLKERAQFGRAADASVASVIETSQAASFARGRSTVKRGHEPHRSIRRCSAREGRPRCFGGAQRGG